MDRNQIIGIVLILGMLLGYQLLMPQPAPEMKPEQEKASSATTHDTVTKAGGGSAEQSLDSAASQLMYGDFAAAATGQSRDIVVENPDIRVTFNTQGGRVKEVLLKNYKTYDQKPLVLLNEHSSEMVLELPTNRGKVNIGKLFFETTAPVQSTVQGDAQTVTFKLALSPTESVEQTYSISAKGFVVDYDLKLTGLDNVVTNQDIRFLWQDKMAKFENDMAENRKSATINYLSADENFDGLSEGESSQEATLEEPVKWFTIKHKYFLAGFIAENSPLKKAVFKTVVDPLDNSTVKTAIADVLIPIDDVKRGKGNYRFYFGPNDYQLLDEVAPEFDQNVYLGYAFLKPVNKYFFVPVFSFLEKYISNYGLLIIALVIFVKLLLTPLTYKSYISMAKMRVLGPEVNAIREKVGDDMAKQQQETMKLYQQVGVSPLSGCIPVLATMPVLMALFFLFPNLIELRQQPFLWSDDLSTYDSFVKFPFQIPILGSHLSLFTIFMTASSLAYAYYNNQMTPAQPNSPINMKAMSYIFPLMFMFVLNSFPAGLTFYYFVSNVVTIAQQLLIRKFVDEDKIKAVLDENRKKFEKGDVKKSKFQDILQRSLQQAEEAKKQAEAAKKRAKK